MNELYPLKFKPIFKEKIWGGNRIKTKLGLDFSPLKNCGEAWVLSGVENDNTVVSNGFLADNELNELVEVYMDDLVGSSVYEKYGKEFPLLIKFIDANDYLSIQVHPDDELAAKRKIGRGKTEMWYIIDAEKGAELISGFNQKVDKDTYLKHLQNKTLRTILNVEKVLKDDVFYMPAGRVHAIGPGILLAEIQQTSDTTYRIYDWDRKDENGKSRELHIDEALDAIDFNFYNEYKTNYLKKINKTNKVIESQFFTTNYIHLNAPVEKNYEELDSFVILINLEGKCSIGYKNNLEILKTGEVVLIPASIDNIRISPENEVKLLEVYII